MQVHVHHSAVVTGVGARGKYSLPQILADHVTLSQSGGKLCPTHYDSPNGFSELPTALHLGDWRLFTSTTIHLYIVSRGLQSFYIPYSKLVRFHEHTQL